MTVEELIMALRACNPKNKVVIDVPYQGVQEVGCVIREDLGGVGSRMSYEKIHTVHLFGQTAPGHLSDQGCDVVYEKNTEFDKDYDYKSND